MKPLRQQLVLILAATLLAATGARAQNVRPTVDDVARSWSRADAGAIAAGAARAGIAIEIGGDKHGPLNARQVSAVLRRLFDERETVQVSAGMAKVVEGSPDRAFGDLVWTARARGTTQPQRSTVFLAFVLEGERWRLTEIRVLQ